MTKLEMTTGSIFKKILLFALPMLVGSLFQLAYSTVDGIVLGRFISESSLAAVGAATSIYNVLSFFLIGLCNGASILMSEMFGAKRMKTLKQNIGTCITSGIIVALVMTLIFAILARPILGLTNLKEELTTDATTYLCIVSLGLVFTFIYNIYTVALRSMGDSLRPIYILALASIMNVGLDFLFVLTFKWGVMGVALATIISQATSAIVIIIYASIINDIFKFSWRDLKIVKAQLKETSKYALASALQQIVLFIGKSLVQISVNALSIEAQAAYAATGKIDDFAVTPVQCIGNSGAIFIAQNRGAKKIDRCKKGLFTALIMSTSVTIVVLLGIYFFKEPLLRLFTDPTRDVDLVIEEGLKFYKFMVFFYLFPAVTNSMQCYFRGLGKLNIVFCCTTIQIIFRTISSYFLIKYYGMSGAALCTAVGWTAMILFELPILIYYLKTNKELNHITEIDVISDKS